MTALDFCKMDGVRDLTPAVKLPFAKALLAEYNGNTAEANEWLEKAIEAEAKLKAA